MRVKVFEVSIDPERSGLDENRLNKFINSVNVKKTSTHFINGAFNCWSVMVFYEPAEEHHTRTEESEKKRHSPEQTVKSDIVFSEDQKNLMIRLREWRAKKATELSLPVFMICRNDDLEQLVLSMPVNIEQLEQVKGFGKQKSAKYGKELFKIIKAHRN